MSPRGPSHFRALHGAPDGLGDLAALAAGFGAHEGLGIPGPYGITPSQMIPADTYEISGTQVALRKTPDRSSDANIILRFNNGYGANGGIVVGTPDQVTTDGQTATGSGLTWAHVTAPQDGYVATEYLAPVGWTASHGGTAAQPSGGGVVQGGGITTQGGGVQPAGLTTAKKSDLTLPILIGAGVLGVGIVGWALMAKPKGAHAVRRAGRRRRGGARRRARR